MDSGRKQGVRQQAWILPLTVGIWPLWRLEQSTLGAEAEKISRLHIRIGAGSCHTFSYLQNPAGGGN
jgi:hypothetical protein